MSMTKAERRAKDMLWDGVRQIQGLPSGMESPDPEWEAMTMLLRIQEDATLAKQQRDEERVRSETPSVPYTITTDGGTGTAGAPDAVVT